VADFDLEAPYCVVERKKANSATNVLGRRTERNRMSAKSSETMMDLLKELALLKQLDEKFEREAGSSLEISEFELRQDRRREIANQIKTLAEPASE
jgi:hypothetical protein